MNRPLREILADSHIAAVAIAVLLFWSLDWAFQALWFPVSSALGFLFTAIAIFGLPYFSSSMTVGDRFMLVSTFSYLCFAALTLSAAWLLSSWVYGVGPLRTLIGYRNRLNARQDA